MNNQTICLADLGYVGLSLAVSYAEKFQVIGLDINSTRIQDLEDGHDVTLEIEENLLASVKDNIQYTSDIQDTKDCNALRLVLPVCQHPQLQVSQWQLASISFYIFSYKFIYSLFY